MLSIYQVEENIKNNIKMKVEEIPYNIGVPTYLILTSHIDDEIIKDQYEDYMTNNSI